MTTTFAPIAVKNISDLGIQLVIRIGLFVFQA